ncbi:MAG: hypothetical protein ACOX0Z_03810 [Candidatus Nanosyncoccaceae bacterium]
MKRAINPLYPSDKKNKLVTSYQQAAFMNDTDATFKKKHEPATKSVPVSATTNRREVCRAYDQRRREITNAYKTTLKELRNLKKAGKITSSEYRSRKRQLKRQTSAAYSENFKSYILNR